MLATLVACGGTSSNDSSNASSPASSNNDIVNKNGDSITQLQGFYQATVGGKKFISLVLPANGGVARWYGWYFNKPLTPDADPDLYSGNLTLGINGAAQSNGADIRIYFGNTLNSRSASFSQASLDSFQSTITNVVTKTSETISATAQIVLKDSLQGTWEGTWSSAGNTLASKKIIFDGNGVLTSMEPFYNCKVNANELLLTARAGNLYDAAITLRSDQPAGNCAWVTNGVSVTFSGVGFIHTSPVAGKKRLELMLLDTDGRGISFWGDL